MKLRRMLVKGAVFELVDPHNLHEVQICVGKWWVQYRRYRDISLICAIKISAV